MEESYIVVFIVRRINGELHSSVPPSIITTGRSARFEFSSYAIISIIMKALKCATLGVMQY